MKVRLKQIIQTYVLRRLLRRRPPERLRSSSPDWGKRNDIYVRGSADEHEDALLLEIGNDHEISYVWWPTDNHQASSTDAKCSFRSVNWESLSITQEYHTWRINYSSPYYAFLNDLFYLPQIRFLVQWLRDRFYTPLTPDKRMQILSEVVKRHDAGRKVTFIDLLIKLYGPSIRLSSDQYNHLQRLKFILMSLDATDDVRVRPEHEGSGRDWVQWELHGDVIPEPKAIATLAEHADSQRKHRDTVRLSIMQFFLGLAMLVVAIATLVVRVSGVKP